MTSLLSRWMALCNVTSVTFFVTVFLVTTYAESVTSPRWTRSVSPPSRTPAESLRELLEIIQDGKIYPVLSHEEASHDPLSDSSQTTHNAFDSPIDGIPTEDNENDNDIFDIDDNIDADANTESRVGIVNGNTVAVEETDVEEIEPKDKTEKEIDVQSKIKNVTINKTIVIDRDKREVKQTVNKTIKEAGTSAPRRVKTGDTILNIRGALKDSIGDAGASSGASQTSRIDTFVIHPAQHQRDAPPPLVPWTLPTKQASLKSSIKELVVEPHSRARLPCDLQNATNIRWLKDGEQVSVSHSASSSSAIWWDGIGGGIALRAGRGEVGRWRCTGERAGAAVSGAPLLLTLHERVRSVYLAVDGRRLDAGNTWVPVREKTDLEVSCVAEGGVPVPDLQWRLVAADPSLDARLYLRHDATNHSAQGVSLSRAVVTAARELHNASLQCVAAQSPLADAPATASTPAPIAKLEIHVTYPPSFVISRWPGFGVSLRAGAAAALRCDVDANPPARAWWQRDGHHATSSPPPLESGAGDGEGQGAGGATLRWGALSHSHAGWYRCRATWADTDYSSIGYYLNILSAEEGTSPSPTTTGDRNGNAGTAGTVDEPEHQKVDVPFGGMVQLHCPKGSVGCWWRRLVGNSSALWAPAGSHHAHGVLAIKDAIYQEAGEYRCLGASAPDLARLKELKRVTVRVTGGPQAIALSTEQVAGGWRLVCGACGRRVKVRWLLPHQQWEAGSLIADLEQHCWRALLYVTTAEEVWCVVTQEQGGGSVAVFPPRTPPAPAHAPRALAAGACAYFRAPILLPFYLLAVLIYT